MVVVSFSVPSVSFPIFFVGLDLRILFDVIVAFVIWIARAVTIGALSELAHALPAEVEAALVARHVIAAEKKLDLDLLKGRTWRD